MHKRIFWIVGLWLMPLLLMAEVNNISISGKVLNANDRQVKVVLYSFVPGEEARSSATSLDKENNFQFVAYIREPIFGRIIYGEHSTPIYLEPGSELHISFNAENFSNSLAFSGSSAAENRSMAQLHFIYDVAHGALLERAKKKAPADFIEWAQERRQKQQAFLTAKAETLDPTFLALQQANIDYQWANELFAYAALHKENKSKRYQLPDTYFSFVDEVKLHNYDVISLESYRSFLHNYLSHLYAQTHKIQPEEDNRYYNHMYELAADNLRSLPKFHMQAEYLVKAINYLGLDKVKDEYIEFANECPIQPYKNEMHELIKMQNVFEDSKPKVVFKAKDGKAVPLQELKGNIVLVRFDNSSHTIAPEELKRRDELLKQQLATFKDVKFLQLSMAENRDAYERMVYADANEYLRSIINRPKPGQEVSMPPWSYVVLNREGLVVSNSLDDPRNELAIEKIKVILHQEDNKMAAE